MMAIEPFADELVARIVADFDAVEIAAADRAPRRSSLAADCSHPSHAGREWRLAGGRWVCGVCQPPAAGLEVAWRVELLEGGGSR